MNRVFSDIVNSPLNIALVGLIAYFSYKLLTKSSEPKPSKKSEILTKMSKRDFTLEELRPYNGKNGDGRILIGVLGRVFDVTKGKGFYGPSNLIHYFLKLKFY